MVKTFHVARSVTVTLRSSVEESNRRFACPGEEVIFDCETTGLQILWTIPPIVNSSNPIPLLQRDIDSPPSVHGNGSVVAIVINDNPLRSLLYVRGQLQGISSTNVTCATNGDSMAMPYEVAGINITVASHILWLIILYSINTISMNSTTVHITLCTPCMQAHAWCAPLHVYLAWCSQ